MEELAGQKIEFSQHFREHILQCWIPRAVDAIHGGFHQDYAEDWTKLPDTTRSLVYHARMIWLAASGGETAIADEGCKALWEKFWDQDYGGFVWSVPLDGGVTDPEKHLYGNAFAVFALAKAGKIHDANWAFQWFDLHAHDEEHGGYFEALWSDGDPNLSSDGKDAIGTPYGLKSMNTNLHILEALIELYKLGGDSKVKTRLRETFEIFRSRFACADGRLVYYVTNDLAAASEIDSYGHAMEAAFLMIEAAEVLDFEVSETWVLARAMVDRTLTVGWDEVHGGMFNEGHFDQPPHDRTKVWWVQAESFNALRVMAERYGEPYRRLMDEQWSFIARFVLDREHGGWRASVGEDGTAMQGQIKSDGWTEGYHQGRAVLLAKNYA